MNARSSVSTPLSIQPRPSSCGVARSASVQAKRLLAKSTSSSSSPASIRVMYSAWSPNGSTPMPAGRLPDRVPRGQRVLGLDPDLVAEVAGVAGPRDRDLAAADLAPGDPEVRQRLDARLEAGEDPPRARALEAEHGPVLGDLLDHDLVAPGHAGPGSTRGSARRRSGRTRPSRAAAGRRPRRRSRGRRTRSRTARARARACAGRARGRRRGTPRRRARRTGT